MKQLAAHVHGSDSRASAEDDEVFCPDCWAGMESPEHWERCEWSGYAPEAHDAISAELVACTLGARTRPELLVEATA